MGNEVKKIDINGITLAYREYGSGDKYLISTQNFFDECPEMIARDCDRFFKDTDGYIL